jgi:hypothetical protein
MAIKFSVSLHDRGKESDSFANIRVWYRLGIVRVTLSVRGSGWRAEAVWQPTWFRMRLVNLIIAC